MRKYAWKQKVVNQATKALFLAKYVLKKQDTLDQVADNVSENNV